MKRYIYIYAALEIFLLALVYWLALQVLHAEYLFKWTTHNWEFYLFISAIALLFLFSKKVITSVSMTIGVTAGIFVAFFWGKWIYTVNTSLIVEGMSPEEVYMLEKNPSVPIWWGIILLSIAIGIIIEKILKWRSKKQQP